MVHLVHIFTDFSKSDFYDDIKPIFWISPGEEDPWSTISNSLKLLGCCLRKNFPASSWKQIKLVYDP